MAGELRTVIVIDYQNVHLTGHQLFEATRHLPKHETLVDPFLFANRLLQVRKASQRPGHPAAVLDQVLVFRGEPSPEHDLRGYAQTKLRRRRLTDFLGLDGARPS